MDVEQHLPDRPQKWQVRVNIQVPGEGKRTKFAKGVTPSLGALFTLHLRQLLVQALPRWIVVGKTWRNYTRCMERRFQSDAGAGMAARIQAYNLLKSGM